MERLEITNFAGMDRVELDLRKINVLIGPQASGKSVCAKLLYYFKGFIGRIADASEDEEGEHELDRESLSKFEDYFPQHTWPDGHFTLRYEIGDAFIEVAGNGAAAARLRLTYSDCFREQLRTTREEIARLTQASVDIPGVGRWRAFLEARSNYVARVSGCLGYPVGATPLFVPAERSFFAFLQSGVFTFLSSNQTIDPFLVEFGRYYEDLKAFSYGVVPEAEPSADALACIDQISQEILCGRYFREKDKDLLEHSDGRRVNIANSSSGQQEMFPLAVMLKALLTFRYSGSDGWSVFIEEPEAHIFPTAQRRIVELLATVFNTAGTPMQLTITTHSPYILTAFNNLLEAGSLAQRLKGKKRQQLEKLVPTNQMISPNDFAVYSLGDGGAKSICCDETGLIDTNIIDEVSNDLSVQFGNLLELE